MTNRPRVCLLGTLDTKGLECAFVRERLIAHALDVVTVDVGILGHPRTTFDVSRDQVAEAAGASFQVLTKNRDRGAAIGAMSRGALAVVTELFARGLDGAIAIGGSGNASIASAAFTALPVGTAKMLVSTVASGDTRPYVLGRDITLVYPIVDIAGINSISAAILSNAVAGFAGMVESNARPSADSERLLAASMFGVTTACVDVARAGLEARGAEVLVFHATGEGGRSMESLIASGSVCGVLDATTTELTDDLLGGICSAGPHRLEAGAREGIPQVVAPGAMDIVNFGPPETVPSRYSDRLLYRHNRSSTLMRTNPDEAGELGRRLAHKLNASTGPTYLFIPLQGISDLDFPGRPFYAPDANRRLFEALRTEISPGIRTVVLDLHINDPDFGAEMAVRLNVLVDEFLNRKSQFSRIDH